MKQENKKDQINQEQLKDQELIEKNQAIFWLVSTVACEQSGYGSIVVDMKEPSTEGEYPFSYLTKGEIEFKDERLERLLRDYDPHREFVISFSRPDDSLNVYLGEAPEIGWWDLMNTK